MPGEGDTVGLPDERPHRLVAGVASAAAGAGPRAAGAGPEVVAVPVASLRAADSPRLNGEDDEHIARLAEAGAELPPILVDRRTTRVIDGMHRLRVASLRGQEVIEVRFFDGSEADVFLRAVEENVAHGLPLTRADRRAAAERVIASHPHMSDRAISHSVGLSAYTVAAIRRGSGERFSQSSARIGTDGKVRPLNSEAGRRRAAELLAGQPGASLREVARVAGISPTTVRDVRKRLERGESPVPGRPAAVAVRANGAGGGAAAPGLPHGNGRTADCRAGNGDDPPAGDGSAAPAGAGRPGPGRDSRPARPPDPVDVVEKLLRDPSLRDNELGKGMLRLLHVNATGAQRLPHVAAALPAHCIDTVALLARQYAKMWQDLAHELGRRAQMPEKTTAPRSLMLTEGRAITGPALLRAILSQTGLVLMRGPRGWGVAVAAAERPAGQVPRPRCFRLYLHVGARA